MVAMTLALAEMVAMTLALLAAAGTASAHANIEYFTGRDDALGSYMRCLSDAFNGDDSIGSIEAEERIAVECSQFREEAIDLFIPAYQERMKLAQPITDRNVAANTIAAVVLAEQMRKEDDGLIPERQAQEVEEKYQRNAQGQVMEMAIQPYRRCLGLDLAERLPESFDLAVTYTLAHEAFDQCSDERAKVSRLALDTLKSDGVRSEIAQKAVEQKLCEVDQVWIGSPRGREGHKQPGEAIPVVDTDLPCVRE